VQFRKNAQLFCKVGKKLQLAIGQLATTKLTFFSVKNRSTFLILWRASIKTTGNTKKAKQWTSNHRPPGQLPQYLTTELFKHPINFFYQKVNPLMI
jgi:hypothetical protein